MRIQIKAESGMLLKNGEGDCRLAAQLWRECEIEPGCPYPFLCLIDGDEYFAEDIEMLAEN